MQLRGDCFRAYLTNGQYQEIKTGLGHRSSFSLLKRRLYGHLIVRPVVRCKHGLSPVLRQCLRVCGEHCLACSPPTPIEDASAVSVVQIMNNCF
jgi:hypothetical protein